MALEILGPGLLEQDADGRLVSRVGTVFPRHRLLVTLPGIHATQRLAFLTWLDQQRQAGGQTPLAPAEQARESEVSVDLFFEAGSVLIRPDPDHMELAFEADEVLQERVSKRNIKFLFVYNPKVQKPIKERGECWRISPLPRSPFEMRALISESKVAITEGPIYYYSRATGTRYVTCQQFAELERLEAPALARQLQEIADHACCRNRLGNPEVDFFEADRLRFGARDFSGPPLAGLEEGALRARYARLRDCFQQATPALFQRDEPLVEAWRNRFFAALVSPPGATYTEEMLRGLSPEFFLQIEWLAGGRFEEGEFIFDPIYQEAEANPRDEALQRLCDPKARGFIFNFIRQYGDLEYVNVGHILHSLSKRTPGEGRRDVYIAELKPRNAPAPLVRFLRMLKWGVKERLDEGKSLLQAMLGSEEYIDYLLDRRLGCRQLGMNLPAQIIIRRVAEVYQGQQTALRGQTIRTPYSERDYINGAATDKVPPSKLAEPGYALALARLLGKAAASNLIVGRNYDEGKTVIFDDGDEVVIDGEDGLPRDLIVGDHSGAFGEYRRPLADFAREYARPVNSRAGQVAHPREFAEAYLAALRTQLMRVQKDYRRYRRGFDTLFKHCNYDPAGSFAYRWECVLKRLDQTDPEALLEAIRQQITVLPAAPLPA
jgi:hypothetical protein